MNLVDKTIKVPQAEADLVDAAIIAWKDFKAGKGASTVADEFPFIIKIGSELGELMAELKSKESLSAAAYLMAQIGEI